MKTLTEIKTRLWDLHEANQLSQHDLSLIAIYTGALDRFEQGKGDPTVILDDVSDKVLGELDSFGATYTTEKVKTLRGQEIVRAVVKFGK